MIGIGELHTRLNTYCVLTRGAEGVPSSDSSSGIDAGGVLTFGLMKRKRRENRSNRRR